MFSGIVPWYDCLNRLLSLRRDVYWRRTLVQGLTLPENPRVLDLAAGTLDVSLELAQQLPRVQIVAADFSLKMLLKGKEKLPESSSVGGIFPVVADAYTLPASAGQFDAVTMAFGIRNLLDRPAGLREIYRILKPGGIIAVLEFVPPEKGWLLKFYRLYLQRLLPLVGKVLSQHAFAYYYLAQSITNFPPAPVFCRQIQEAGFHQVRGHSLTHGIAYLFYGRKPFPTNE